MASLAPTNSATAPSVPDAAEPAPTPAPAPVPVDDRFEVDRIVEDILAGEQPEVADDDPNREPYYWEAGGNENVSTLQAVWHNTHWAGTKVFHGLEFMGEVAASFLGLNQSRYQWAIDAAERERAEIEHEILLERQRKLLAKSRDLSRVPRTEQETGGPEAKDDSEVDVEAGSTAVPGLETTALGGGSGGGGGGGSGGGGAAAAAVSGDQSA